jgi:hypothetical protein
VIATMDTLEFYASFLNVLERIQQILMFVLPMEIALLQMFVFVNLDTLEINVNLQDALELIQPIPVFVLPTELVHL